MLVAQVTGALASEKINLVAVTLVDSQTCLPVSASTQINWPDDLAVYKWPPRKRAVEVWLKEHPERRFYIDIKNVDLKQLAYESKGVHKQLILASTKYDVIREWKRLAPDSSTLHWMGGTEAELGKRLHKTRRARRDHQIAGERNIRAGARCHAIDGGHYRQRQPTQ